MKITHSKKFLVPHHIAKKQNVAGIFPIRENTYQITLLQGLTAKSLTLTKEWILNTEATDITTDTIPRNAQIVLALPRKELIVKTIHIPADDPQRIAQMMQYESTAHLPWPEEESQIAFDCQTSDQDGYTDILLLMALADSINHHFTALKKVGITPTIITPLFLFLTSLTSQFKTNQNIAVYFEATNSIEYIHYQHGRHLFSRGTDKEEAPSIMLSRSLELDRRRVNGEDLPSQIFTASPIQTIDPSLAKAAGNIPIAPLTNTESFPTLLNTDTPEKFASRLAASNADKISTTANLVPYTEARKHAIHQIIQQSRKMAIAILCFFTIIIGGGHYSLTIEHSRVEDAEKQISQLRIAAGHLKEQSETLKLLNAEEKRVAIPLHIILELFKYTPINIAIDSLVYDTRQQLTFGGESPSFQALFEYTNALAQSPLLKDIEIKHGMKPQGNGKEIVEFKVTCTVKEKP